MSVVLTRQAAEFLGAAALGAALGVIYDLGRAVRREKPALSIPTDLLFALLFFLALMLTSIYTGGLRLYQCLGLGMGSALYFLTLSTPLVQLIRCGLRAIGRLVRWILYPAKKSFRFLKKLAKKLFSSLKKWGTIKVIPFSRRHQEENPP